jgi:hypothetical protein
MAMNGNTLGTAIFNAVKSQLGWTPPGGDNAQALAAWQAIAAAIVSHIQSSGVVNVTVATTGTAAAQTGTGTGTVS